MPSDVTWEQTEVIQLRNYFYLSLLILTHQYKQKTPKWKEKLPEMFDRDKPPVSLGPPIVISNLPPPVPLHNHGTK